MRIVFITHRYPNPYKPYFDVQFEQLVGSGHEVTVLSLARIEVTRSHEVPFGVKVIALHRFRSNPVRSLIAMFRVVTRSPRHAWKALESGRRSGQSFITIANALVIQGQLPAPDPDLYFAHGLGVASKLWPMPICRPAARYVMYYHGGELPSVPRIFPQTAHLAFGAASLIFTNTAASAADAVSRSADAARVRIVPVGFRISDYVPDRRLRTDTTQLRIVSVGRIAAEKGIDVALRAIAMLKEKNREEKIHFTIVGDGPDLPRIRSLAVNLGLASDVEFTGRLAHTDVLLEMNRSNALVLTSVGGNTATETQACVLQEALLMELPVVASVIGGVPESLPEEMKPFLYPPGDFAALVDRLNELLFSGRYDLESLGRIGRRFVLASYDIAQTNAALLDAVRRRWPD